MGPEAIKATAERIRSLGVPDSLNRWLAMTPDKLEANKAARAQIARQVLNPTERKKAMEPSIGPKEAAVREARMQEPTPAMKATAETMAKPKPKASPKATKPHTEAPKLMASVTTPKAAEPAPPPKTKAAKPAPKKTAPIKTATKPKAKESKAKTAAPADGPRPGSKLAIIHGLLTRPEGCTSKMCLEKTGWPAISMPQQARSLGVKLKKEKVDGVTVYRAA